MILRALFRVSLMCSLCLSPKAYAGHPGGNDPMPEDFPPPPSPSSTHKKPPIPTTKRTSSQAAPGGSPGLAVPHHRPAAQSGAASAFSRYTDSSTSSTPPSPPSHWSGGLSSLISRAASGVSGFVSNFPQAASAAFTIASSATADLPLFRPPSSPTVPTPSLHHDDFITIHTPHRGMVSFREIIRILTLDPTPTPHEDINRLTLDFLKHLNISVDNLSANRCLLGELYKQLRWPDPRSPDIQTLSFIILILSTPFETPESPAENSFDSLFALPSLEEALWSDDFFEFIVEMIGNQQDASPHSALGKLQSHLNRISVSQPTGLIDLPVHMPEEENETSDIYDNILKHNSDLLRPMRHHLIGECKDLHSFCKTVWALLEYLKVVRGNADDLGLPFLFTPHRRRILSALLIHMINRKNHLELTLNILLGRSPSLEEENALLASPTLEHPLRRQHTVTPPPGSSSPHPLGYSQSELDLSSLTEALNQDPTNDPEDPKTSSQDHPPEPASSPASSHFSHSSLRRATSAESQQFQRLNDRLTLRSNRFSFPGLLGTSAWSYFPTQPGDSTPPPHRSQPSRPVRLQLTLGGSIDDTPDEAALEKAPGDNIPPFDSLNSTDT